MKTELELEAEKHWKLQYIMALDETTKPYIIQDFIAGATSAYVERQKLEFAIQQLRSLPNEYSNMFFAVVDKIKELEQKLQELCNTD